MDNQGPKDLPQHHEVEENSENEEEDEPKVCQVCGDRATGYHFNAMTCEGCKGFFRRAMKRPVNFSCPFRGVCIITKNNRRQCQACRLQKCRSIGMLKELIMSDEELGQRRRLLERRRKRAEPVILSTQQEAVIQELLNAQKKTFDISFVHFTHFRPIDRTLAPMQQYRQTCQETTTNTWPSDIQEASLPCSSSSSPCSSSSQEVKPEDSCGKDRAFTTLPHIADLSTYMIQQIISFAKMLSSFKELSIEDQISLLKGATFELCQIRFNMLFNESSGMWECGPLTYCMDDAARDRPGVTDSKTIDQLQEMLALTLKTYIESKRTSPKKHLLYPKIMGCLTEMRSMNEEYTKQVLQIQDIQPEVPPLMLEVFSKIT
ncbi:nuclear receptor subfamily 1 group I member 2 isoform X6 [Scleropages formosus]|uniref:nuclear receptor subfamily 1 group I member 2 isoform X6 n=1 Tax=Scleropages formosus TaxID=113540 RepID=UPI0010FA7802|nr:nuclear receptor subfamily 1 group I member 2 isoform X6 [Scleropages formosus]